MQARFRFYAELNDFLAPRHRSKPVLREFLDFAPVKDMIESLGVPHTEVDLILVNGKSVDFSYVVQDRDAISVYPMFESLDITPVLRVRAEPLREMRFVLDTHLGRLAGYLRMLGFDALYQNTFKDRELAELSKEERRVLLTRDHGLLKRGTVTHGYFVRATQPGRQLAEVVQRFDLAGSIHPFTRCMRCNGVLREIAKDAVAGRAPGKVLELHDRFRECAACGRVYWEGSHHARMLQVISACARS